MSEKRPQVPPPELGSKKPLSVEQRRKGSWLPLSLSLAFAALLMHYVWHLEADHHKAEEKKQLRADITEYSPSAVIATNATGEVIEWNHAATRLLGWTEKEAVGAHIGFLLDSRFRDTHQAAMDGAVDAGEMLGRRHEIDCWIRIKNNEPIRVLVSVRMIHTKEGIAFVATIDRRKDVIRLGPFMKPEQEAK